MQTIFKSNKLIQVRVNIPDCWNMGNTGADVIQVAPKSKTTNDQIVNQKIA